MPGHGSHRPTFGQEIHVKPEPKIHIWPSRTRGFSLSRCRGDLTEDATVAANG